MSRAARCWLAVGAALVAGVPWGSLEGQLGRKWPLAKNDTVWEEPTVTAANPMTVKAWRDYIVQNWSPGFNSFCTSDNYSLIDSERD